MALTKGSKTEASDINSLKARVKAEMNRRCRLGSLASYAGTSYDYTTTPATGVKMNVEHINKILTPMSKITSQSYGNSKAVGDLATAPDILSTNLAVYETQAMTKGATSSCSSSCSGLCTTGCYNACTGCTGCTSCSGCSGSCSGCSGCGDDCSWSGFW